MRNRIPVLLFGLLMALAQPTLGFETKDINGDGYDDLVVGAPFEKLGEPFAAGAAHVFYGGEKLLPVRKTDLAYGERIVRIGPGSSRNVFGQGLKLADLNQDGLADLIVGVPGGSLVGAPDWDRSGVLNLFRGNAEGLIPEEELAFVSGTGSHPGLLGFSLGVGDFDGDGTPDLVAGAPGHWVNEVASGAVAHYLTLSVSTTGNQLPALFFNNGRIQDQFGSATNVDGDHFGIALEVADFNGDGQSDLAVGAQRDEVNGVGNGQVFIYRGEAGVPPSTGYQILNSELIDGLLDDAKFGSALASGDFNGDGVADLAVGAPNRRVDGKNDAGEVYIFSGNGNGIFSGGDLIERDDAFPIESGENFGAALVSADFDQDGFDDLIVGAPGARLSIIEIPFVQPILGSTSRSSTAWPTSATARSAPNPSNPPTGGPGAGGSPGGHEPRGGTPGPRDEPNWPEGRDLYEPPFGVPRVAPAKRVGGGIIAFYRGSPSGLFLIERYDQEPLGRNEAHDRFGFALSTGDYNGDGFPDLAVGAPSMEDLAGDGVHEEARGEVYIYYHGASLQPTGRGFFDWLYPGKFRYEDKLFVQQRILAPSASGVGTEFGAALSR